MQHLSVTNDMRKLIDRERNIFSGITINDDSPLRKQKAYMFTIYMESDAKKAVESAPFRLHLFVRDSERVSSTNYSMKLGHHHLLFSANERPQSSRMDAKHTTDNNGLISDSSAND
ncbi:hypothetical protein GCM10009332_04420 [Shewanella gelidii]|uniref:Uncharacterized protein n=1 Tax=Shewanella gelidii TaxID=1642821 RepID=A0A917N6B9_9GAMM|nr:hypothetical protein GCM10009332_04420 [Shewanella gelidii]